MQFKSLEPTQFPLHAFQFAFKSWEMKILPQVEIPVILVPIIFCSIYAIFWSVWNEIIRGYAFPWVYFNAV